MQCYQHEKIKIPRRRRRTKTKSSFNFKVQIKQVGSLFILFHGMRQVIHDCTFIIIN